MIKVMEAISDMNVGGAGRLLISRIKYSDKDNFKYTVILPKKSLLIPFLKNVGANVIEIDACQNRSIDITSLIVLCKIIKACSPDILNSHACFSARIAGRISGVKVNLHTRHCDFPIKDIYRLPLFKQMISFINNALSDGVIAVSSSAKRNLLQLGVNNAKIKIIINGAEKIKELNYEQKKKIKAGLNIPADAIVVSIFARLEVYKDHVTFLRAAKVLSKFDKIYFLIVGNGSLEKELKKYAKKLGLEKKVIFLGFVEDVSEIMNITDVNVNCSIGTETSSLALSEGMSLGIPAIASDYLGNKYIVKDGINGLIFEQRDYIGLAKRILLLYGDKNLYAKLSKNSKQRFLNELNAKRMTLETENYYMSALKSKTF